MKTEAASGQDKLEEPQPADEPTADAALSAWRKLCPVKFRTELDQDQTHGAYA